MRNLNAERAGRMFTFHHRLGFGKSRLPQNLGRGQSDEVHSQRLLEIPVANAIPGKKAKINSANAVLLAIMEGLSNSGRITNRI
jgi:hypothetical protein